MVSRETVDCMVFCGCLFNLMDFRLPEIFAKRFFGWRQCVLQSVLVGEPPTLHCVFKTLWQRWFQAALRFKEVGMFKKFDKAGAAEKTRGGQGALRAPCGEAGCAQSGGFAGVGELASGGV